MFSKLNGLMAEFVALFAGRTSAITPEHVICLGLSSAQLKQRPWASVVPSSASYWQGPPWIGQGRGNQKLVQKNTHRSQPL